MDSDLAVSIDGGAPVPVNSIVAFQAGRPIALIKVHGNTVIYMDAAREPHELLALVRSLGFAQRPEHRLVGRMQGQMKF